MIGEDVPDLKDMIRRQQVLATFGEFAIRSDSLDEVLTEACRLVSEASGAGRAKVLEIQEDRQELLVRAGVGWASNVVGKVRLPMSERSSETYAIRSAKPIVSQDVRIDDRFELPNFMKQAGVVALANVPIFVPGQRPYGVLQIDDTRPRAFGADEIEFLRTYAMILGPVIDRLHLVEERKLSAEQLRLSEARHRLLIESWAQAVWEVDAEGLVVTDSPSWRAYTGQTLAQWLGDGWLNAIHPDDRGYAERQWRQAVATRSLVNAEFRLRAPDGGWRWTNVRAAPVIDAQGRIERWAGMNIDIDARKRAEAALRESEQRLQTLVEGVPQLVWRAADVGHWTWASPQWTAFTGQAEPDSQQWGWLDAVHPDDRERAREAWSRAVERGGFQADYRIRHTEEGRFRWFQTRAAPVRNEAGEIVEWLGTSTDVEDLRSLQERQRVLLFELQHRVRNTLAVVRSLSKSTAGSSDTVDGFQSHFEGRLSALARAQVVLTRSPGEGVDLEVMVREELLAQAAREDHIEISGPNVRLSPKAAEVLALAVHELTTNAVKYGALGVPDGRVEVRWSTAIRDGEVWLELEWRERGVRVMSGSPRREGFGTELIATRVPYELQGSGVIHFLPGGVHSAIAFPLRSGESILQTGAPSRRA